MLFVASDRHVDHRMLEVHNGEVIDSFDGPERAAIIETALRARGDHDIIDPDELDTDLLGRVHDADYLELLATAWDRWVADGHEAPAAMSFAWPARSAVARRPADLVGQLGWHSFGSDCSLVAGTWRAVRASAACAHTAADRLVAADERAVNALSRTPGPHATAGQFGGYCFVNNAVVAAQRLLDRGHQRVGIVDVDYHHGNGTQSITEHRSDIVFASIHATPAEEFPWFSGYADETGTGDGVGCNLNVPLLRGADVGQWFSALADVLLFLSDAVLDALVVSLGVDTYDDDPLGTFGLTTLDFTKVANELSLLDLPTVIVQEGGYADAARGDNVAAFLAGCPRPNALS